MTLDPNPRLDRDAPLEVLEARTLFRSPAIRRRGAASLRRLGSGRLLMTFLMGTGPAHMNDGAVMLTYSDDEGRTWDEPFPIYAYPGWDSLPLGGIAHIRDDLLHLVLGRVRYDESLGGDEPFAGWWVAITESRDGGRSWSEVGPEPHLYPEWTEFYGTSNPFRRSDGNLIWTVIGTEGRDIQWQSGVSVTGPEGGDFSPVTLIASDPALNYADTDLLRLDDRRFIAVIREMFEKEGWIAFSDDECRSWHGLRKVGFRASNIKLIRLRDGSALCAYRDEDPARHGVSLSHSRDGGQTWTTVGQLYANRTALHRPGRLCGYPDMVSLGDGRIAAVLHTYTGDDGRADLQFFILRDRT